MTFRTHDGSVRHMPVAPEPGQVRVLGTDFGEVSSIVAVPTPEGDDVVVVHLPNVPEFLIAAEPR